jgi:hypothetical protein
MTTPPAILCRLGQGYAELRHNGVLRRWDEKADPLRSTLWVCKG